MAFSGLAAEVVFTASQNTANNIPKASGPYAHWYDAERQAYRPSEAVKASWARGYAYAADRPFRAAVYHIADTLLGQLPPSIFRTVEATYLFRGNSENTGGLIAKPVPQSLAHFKRNSSFSAEEQKVLSRLQELTFTTTEPFASGRGSTATHTAWFSPPAKGKPTILYSPGQVGRLSNARYFMPWLKAGYGFIIYEYPGYGKSRAATSEPWIYETAETVSHLLVKKGIPKKQQILWGYSMGGAPTAYLASKEGYKAVIMQSTMHNFPEVVEHQMITKWGIRHWVLPVYKHTITQFPVQTFLQANTSPILFIHGKQDKDIPWQYNMMLNELAVPNGVKKRGELIPDAGHWIDTAVLEPRVNAFLKTLN